MAVPFKATFFFEGTQTGTIGASSSVGWTETWYKSMDSTIEQAISDPDLSKYLKYRTACLSSLYRISFVRVSQDGAPRRFKLQGLNNVKGNVDPIVGAPAQVQCAVLVDLEKLPGIGTPLEPVHHRRFLLRGLPADIIDGNVINVAGPSWGAITTFFNFIGNKPTAGEHPIKLERFSWGLRYYDPAMIRLPIFKALPSPSNNKSLLITSPVQPVLVRGNKVLVTGVESPQVFNKVWTYLGTEVVGGVEHQAFGTAKRRLQGVYDAPGKGEYFKLAYLYGPVDQYAIIGLRSKKTGRVFRQLRGRS